MNNFAVQIDLENRWVYQLSLKKGLHVLLTSARMNSDRKTDYCANLKKKKKKKSIVKPQM